MATVETDIKQSLLEGVEKSHRGDGRNVLKNPWQFHGDTGIMHYLYHRVLCNGGDRLFHSSASVDVGTLLFQSGFYTPGVVPQEGQEG